MADVFRAREAFAYTDKQGVPRVVSPGFLISSDDPNYKGKEHLFEPVEAAAARSAGAVEEATAEPGVPRSMGFAKGGVVPVGRERPAKEPKPPVVEPPPIPKPTRPEPKPEAKPDKPEEKK